MYGIKLDNEKIGLFGFKNIKLNEAELFIFIGKKIILEKVSEK